MDLESCKTVFKEAIWKGKITKDVCDVSRALHWLEGMGIKIDIELERLWFQVTVLDQKTYILKG